MIVIRTLDKESVAFKLYPFLKGKFASYDDMLVRLNDDPSKFLEETLLPEGLLSHVDFIQIYRHANDDYMAVSSSFVETFRVDVFDCLDVSQIVTIQKLCDVLDKVDEVDICFLRYED